MAKTTAGEALVNLLADYGVELVFGIPGTHSIELYRGLECGRIRHISPRHEQGGGFMADGYARASGKPGVCFVITGPGVTNLTTPMGEAYMDSVPMLVISPVNDPDPDHVNRGRLHEITCQAAVTDPITAFSITIADASEIPDAVAQAFEVFSSARPRPVHINIPLSIIPREITEVWQAVVPGAPNRAGDGFIEDVAIAVQSSVQSVLVIGGGTTCGADQIQRLAEKICCPVISTVAARGVVPADHPLNVGAQLRAPYVQEALEASDLAIFLGTEFAQTDHWNDDLQLPQSQVWVNLCPSVLDQRQSALTVQADCIDFAERLAAKLAQPGHETIARVQGFCKSLRQNHRRDFDGNEDLHWKVLEVIRDTVPDSVTIVSDMTQIAYTAVDYLPMNRPNQWLHPTGYGTLGYALPAAIGAALADESKPVLAIVGDAGLQYTMQELTLASELGLKIVVLLWNNDALQQICDDMDNAGIARIGVVQKNPDFLALAKACHWAAWAVADFNCFSSDLERALNAEGPVLIMLDQDTVE
jgi:5-guanidino-2-oxopentanoate decarboxylase